MDRGSELRALRQRLTGLRNAVSEIAREVDAAVDRNDTDARRRLFDDVCKIGPPIDAALVQLDAVVRDELGSPHPSIPPCEAA